MGPMGLILLLPRFFKRIKTLQRILHVPEWRRDWTPWITSRTSNMTHVRS
jgi:hypothetical protein